MSHLRQLWLCVVLCLATPALGQDAHRVLSFDEKGKLEDAKAWAKLKDDLQTRKPNHVFLVSHGWRTSKETADETYAYFGKTLLQMQGKDDVIAVIGVRWPSLIGENETAADLAFKQVAKEMARAMANSETVQQSKETLKEYLKKRTTRFLVSNLLGYKLPAEKELDELIDNVQDVKNVEHALTALSYYEMKHRAGLVGENGLARCLTELQESLPRTRFHLVGHSFGCKVWLACLASKDRDGKQVDSLTLLQGAVSMHCFSPKVAELDDMPGAYVDVPKCVKGSISVTFTKNDGALSLAYVGASQAAGQIAEAPTRNFKAPLSAYGALGAKGVAGIAGIPMLELGKVDTPYKLQPGLNALNADDVIIDHGDVRRDEVAWLIWATARARR